jgi:hypothetical protein
MPEYRAPSIGLGRARPKNLRQYPVDAVEFHQIRAPLELAARQANSLSNSQESCRR